MEANKVTKGSADLKKNHIRMVLRHEPYAAPLPIPVPFPLLGLRHHSSFTPPPFCRARLDLLPSWYEYVHGMFRLRDKSSDKNTSFVDAANQAYWPSFSLHADVSQRKDSTTAPIPTMILQVTGSNHYMQETLQGVGADNVFANGVANKFAPADSRLVDAIVIPRPTGFACISAGPATGDGCTLKEIDGVTKLCLRTTDDEPVAMHSSFVHHGDVDELLCKVEIGATRAKTLENFQRACMGAEQGRRPPITITILVRHEDEAVLLRARDEYFDAIAVVAAMLGPLFGLLLSTYVMYAVRIDLDEVRALPRALGPLAAL